MKTQKTNNPVGKKPSLESANPDQKSVETGKESGRGPWITRRPTEAETLLFLRDLLGRRKLRFLREACHAVDYPVGEFVRCQIWNVVRDMFYYGTFNQFQYCETFKHPHPNGRTRLIMLGTRWGRDSITLPQQLKPFCGDARVALKLEEPAPLPETQAAPYGSGGVISALEAAPVVAPARNSGKKARAGQGKKEVAQ